MIHVILLTEFDDFLCRSRTRSRTGKRTKFIPSFHQRVETAAIVVVVVVVVQPQFTAFIPQSTVIISLAASSK